MTNVTVENANNTIESIQAEYYNKYSNGDLITPASAEFDSDEFYTDLGEVEDLQDIITLNGIQFDDGDKKISIGNNAKIVAPVFTVNDENHLLVANVYLVTTAEDGITEVQYGDNNYEVSLEGLDEGDTLEIAEVKGVNTQAGRKNEVGISGNDVVEVSNNGLHMIAVTLEANGDTIVDPNQIIYALNNDGSLGMTSPEASGNAGVYYTYGLYMKYKNGDYTAADAGTKVINKTLVLPGHGKVNITFTLQAEEYVA